MSRALILILNSTSVFFILLGKWATFAEGSTIPVSANSYIVFFCFLLSAVLVVLVYSLPRSGVEEEEEEEK